MSCCRYTQPTVQMLGSADRAVALINASLKSMPGVTTARRTTRVESSGSGAGVAVDTDAGTIFLALVGSSAGISAKKIPHVVVSNDPLVYTRRLAIAIQDTRKVLLTRGD